MNFAINNKVFPIEYAPTGSSDENGVLRGAPNKFLYIHIADFFKPSEDIMLYIQTSTSLPELYNDQRNAQVFNLLSIYFCLTCFGLSLSPSSAAGVQFQQWFKSPGYGVNARALTPQPGDLNHAYMFHLHW
jgi:hypothetical protein